VSLSHGVNRPDREADHSLPFSVKVQNEWSFTFTLPYNLMTWISDTREILLFYKKIEKLSFF